MIFKNTKEKNLNINLGKSQRYTGFTLAEVLITLGIIGVVAGLSIPSLMNEIRDKQFKEAAKKAYSVASQAVSQIKSNEGGTLKQYVGVQSAFKPEFVKYFKVIKDCGIHGCVPSVGPGNSNSLYKSLAGGPIRTDFMDEGQFITSDGMFWAIQNSVNASLGIYITVDVNGYVKSPNVIGIDTFMFKINEQGNLIPSGAEGSILDCSRTVVNDYQGFGCMNLVMQGIDY